MKLKKRKFIVLLKTYEECLFLSRIFSHSFYKFNQQFKQVVEFRERKLVGIVIYVVICLCAAFGVNVETGNIFLVERSVVAVAGLATNLNVFEIVVFVVDFLYQRHFFVEHLAVYHANVVFARADQIEVDDKITTVAIHI